MAKSPKRIEKPHIKYKLITICEVCEYDKSYFKNVILLGNNASVFWQISKPMNYNNNNT